ncbi:hypothetical protein KJY40_12475 [Pseudomonas fitomaticsae]|uniref:Uncharacterized protein n=1 Tax=Pseudomonas fitomaticsae TaxID=2837969 RepID=A0ABY3Q8M8_9PSED|nr:hypothetical protein KJY40_12475 [Pseudomonas fitomaticsae]
MTSEKIDWVVREFRFSRPQKRDTAGCPFLRLALADGSTFHGLTPRAQIMVVDIPATAAARGGIAVGTLVVVIDVAAGTATLLRVAPRTQVMIIDVAATAAALFGIAIGALVMVVNVAAGTAALLRVTRRPQIVIIDVAATAAALPCIAIGTLIVVINVAATGKAVAAEHQQHCE